ncbi:MAG: hypothetical protein MJB12_09925, partial [Firmicutes bacterium]|nr:hypothetical protein [Bacillota bacterium]
TGTVNLSEFFYSWTDEVQISVESYIDNLDPNSIDILGSAGNSDFTLSSGTTTISPLLTETGVDTGLFTNKFF